MAKRRTANNMTALPVVAPKAVVRNNNRPAVTYVRDEVSNYLQIYYLIRDCIEGEPAIKGITGASTTSAYTGAGNGGISGIDLISNVVLSRAVRYLPRPNSEENSLANDERYRAYVTRAVFYNVTARTHEGMTGQIFLREPKTNFPNELEVLKTDADGSGLSLLQVAKRAVRYTLAYGRAGILTDFPVVDGPVTKQDMATGTKKPMLIVFPPWDIVNWRVEQRGSKRVLTFLVLRETYSEDGSDEFSLDNYEQYRVLEIREDGTFWGQVYRIRDINRSDGYDTLDEYQPKDAKGKP